MKKLILNIALFLGITLSVKSQNVIIPDANFKAYLIGRTDSININNDTVISLQEAESFNGKLDLKYTNLSLLNLKRLKDITGIQSFKNITYLNINSNDISKVDLSQNTKIQHLDIAGNFYIDYLDLSKNNELEFLNIDSTSISTIDLKNNLKLKSLWATECKIKNLDLSNNLQLEELNIIGGLTGYLNLKNNINLKKLNSQYSPLKLICVDNVSKALSNPNFIYNNTIKITDVCPNEGEFYNTPLLLTNNKNEIYTTTNFYRGRKSTTSCKTSAIDANTIEVFYSFITDNSTVSIDLSVGNSTWLSKMELLDTLTYQPILNTCQSNVGVGQATRTYSFTGLTVGKKYLVRLELGDVAPLGHARMEAANNTFSIKLNSTVTDVSDNEISSNKTISNIYNLQGLEVSKEFRGLVIYKYTDGTTQKVVQE